MLEQGQIVKLRHKVWVVTSIIKTKAQNDQTQTVHRVALECLSDDALGKIYKLFGNEKLFQLLLNLLHYPKLKITTTLFYLMHLSDLCNGDQVL